MQWTRLPQIGASRNFPLRTVRNGRVRGLTPDMAKSATSSAGVSEGSDRVAAPGMSSSKKGVRMAQIGDSRQLFVHKLGSTLTMEHTIVTMLKELSGKANDTELKQQLAHHREETEQQIRNLNQIFAALGAQPATQPCPVIDALERESKQMLQQTTPELHDAVILNGCAEVEHHEIAVYDGLITIAEQLGHDDIVALLEENLEQEEHTLKEVEKAFEEQAKQLAERVTA